MILDMHNLERLVSLLGEKFQTAVSFTIEIYSIPKVGTRMFTVLWVHGHGTISNADPIELANQITANIDGIIKFDPPN